MINLGLQGNAMPARDTRSLLDRFNSIETNSTSKQQQVIGRSYELFHSRCPPRQHLDFTSITPAHLEQFKRVP